MDKKKIDMQKLLAPAALVVLYVFFSFVGNNFFSLDTAKNILESSYYIGLMAFGVTFIIITGGIDLSLGTVMMCSALLGAYTFKQGWPLLLSVVLTVLVGIVFGALNGTMIAKLKLPPFIATLGTMKIFRSVTQQMTKTFNPEVPAAFKQIASFKIGGQVVLPIIYWVAIVMIMLVIFKKTAFGRQTIAIGSNERAAKLSGIPVAKVKLNIYALSGVMCAIAAIIYIARIGSMDFANAGSGYEMDAIAAVVVGGTSMAGGRGSLVGAFIGMLIIGVMNNILNTVGVPTFLCEAVKGLIIIFAVLLQRKDNG